jgi:hypothetical protein
MVLNVHKDRLDKLDDDTNCGLSLDRGFSCPTLFFFTVKLRFKQFGLRLAVGLLSLGLFHYVVHTQCAKLSVC